MAGTRNWTPRTYTQEQKIALVTEIDRRHRAGLGSLKAIAASLGTTDTSYSNWLQAGIRPAPAGPSPAAPFPAVHRIYSAAEREHFMAEVDRLRDEGQSLVAACRMLAISDKSYRKWKADAMPPLAMRPVEVITALVPAMPRALAIVEPPESRTLTLLAPGGYRIEGLTTGSAAALLKALA